MEMKFKVAVVGGGPSGSCAAEVLAACDDVDVTLFERKMDNAKPCGGAIPLCMIEEFDLPVSIIDRKVWYYMMEMPWSWYCCLNLHVFFCLLYGF